MISKLYLSGQLVKDGSKSKVDQMDFQDIVDEFRTFLFAGMDTTGHLIGISIYLLTQFPEYQDKIRQEIKEMPEITQENLKKMNNLNNFV